ncbi:MAG: biotin--[acetyl-CoA-carboxylase] ligase [Clostridia bacterium]|nr:biotin--[acetyl-CoA-carboxylase] ligase [Clostridia bacterium]
MTRKCGTFTIKVKQGNDKLPCFCFYKATSTNYLAKVFVSENRLEKPAVFLAKTQTQGRGRYDRSFVSPKGGLYMTYVCPAKDGFSLWAIMSAVAVNRVLEKVGVHSSIKWPNDLKVEGKKICGILPESVVTDKRYVVMGIGVNINTDENDLEQVKDIATSVYQTIGKKVSVKKFAKLLTRELHSVFELESAEDTLEEYRQKCETIDKEVVDGEGFSGVALKVTDDGSLIVSNGEEEKEINWGEICYVK